jgi:hypothetical protein
MVLRARAPWPRGRTYLTRRGVDRLFFGGGMSGWLPVAGLRSDGALAMEAVSAVASAASPETNDTQSISKPLRRPFSVRRKPVGVTVSTYGLPSIDSARLSGASSFVTIDECPGSSRKTLAYRKRFRKPANSR